MICLRKSRSFKKALHTGKTSRNEEGTATTREKQVVKTEINIVVIKITIIISVTR